MLLFNFTHHVFIETANDLVLVINISLKINKSLFEFGNFRNAPLVQIFKIIVLGKSLHCTPNSLTVSFSELIGNFLLYFLDFILELDHLAIKCILAGANLVKLYINIVVQLSLCLLDRLYTVFELFDFDLIVQLFIEFLHSYIHPH